MWGEGLSGWRLPGPLHRPDQTRPEGVATGGVRPPHGQKAPESHRCPCVTASAHTGEEEHPEEKERATRLLLTSPCVRTKPTCDLSVPWVGKQGQPNRVLCLGTREAQTQVWAMLPSQRLREELPWSSFKVSAGGTSSSSRSPGSLLPQSQQGAESLTSRQASTLF